MSSGSGVCITRFEVCVQRVWERVLETVLITFTNVSYFRGHRISIRIHTALISYNLTQFSRESRESTSRSAIGSPEDILTTWVDIFCVSTSSLHHGQVIPFVGLHS